MVPAKAGTAYGAAYWRHGSWRHASGPPSAGCAIPAGYAIPQSPQSLKVRNLSKSATSQGTQSLKVRNLSKSATSQGTQSVKVSNLSKSATSQDTQSVSPHPGGGPPARSGRRERCRAIARHEVWCRQSAARSTVPPIGGTKYGAAQRGGTKPPGKGQAQNRRRPCCPPARLGRRERCRPIERHGVWCRLLAARHGAG